MARGGINKALVHKARQTLLARGEHPSIDAVRVELGNTGSKTTIHRYLRELEASESERPVQEVTLGQELGELVAQLAARLEEEAQQTVAPEREALARERVEYQQQLTEAAGRIRQLEADNAALSGQLQAARAACAEEQQLRHQAQIEGARLLQAGEDLAARLADRDAQVVSLEQKHQHAREALEHYRTASKEQREQEQRRHEAQVQQLQVELRQLQQTLIVKQDELTRLNRDNERLVTEARQLRRDMAGREADLERQASACAGLREQLGLAEAGKSLLQSRVEDLQGELARQVEGMTLQARQTEALQASLIEMAAQLRLAAAHAPAERAEPHGVEGEATGDVPGAGSSAEAAAEARDDSAS
ncbi:cointegrate resolution protein T [Pseudomonas sp. A-1]|uniref:DNA-binding protein n=1 Tax=Pseudomonas sp. A-1 TaxID=1821274 RepID=UPI0010A66820|nr:DNA-binding protein [Pseudomonas sp. A-1]THG83088.1 cointegrate resolution protein T [Pseudomonas sp. A-1]